MMKFSRAIVSAVLACTILLPTNALAWTAHEQDLTEVEIEIDETVELPQNTPSNWAKSEIELAVNAGLVPALTGTPKYTDAITREQFAELVVQTVEVMLDRDLDAAADNTFSDSSNASVLKASQSGIVNGIGAGKFEPKTTTNREQIATMIFRAVRYAEAESGKTVAPNAGSLTGFTDQNKVSSWAVEGVGTLAANSIMNGTSATTLSPAKDCTVEESIVLCYRLYDRFVNA